MEEIKQQLQNIYSCMSYITHSRVELVKTRNYLCANRAVSDDAIIFVRKAIDQLISAEANLLDDADRISKMLYESEK